jgi:hypothetical protein
MKRVKIMLTTVAILGVVGGALAFKAKRLDRCYYEIVGSTCPLKLNFKTAPGAGFLNTDMPKPATGCPAQTNPIDCTQHGRTPE